MVSVTGCNRISSGKGPLCQSRYFQVNFWNTELRNDGIELGCISYIEKGKKKRKRPLS